MDAKQMVEELILDGSIEPFGIDNETGEFLYSFTDKLKELHPELHNNFNNHFYSSVISLWEKGFIEMDVTEVDPKIHLTRKALDMLEIAKLGRNDKARLLDLLKQLREE